MPFFGDRSSTPLNGYNQLPPDSLSQIDDTLTHYNPKTALLRPLIESVWEAITSKDDWQPFQELVIKLQNKQ
jgi:uncharacterized protein YdiU (UPF0061 family)